MADHDSLQISRRDALRVLGVGLGAGVVGSVASASLAAQAAYRSVERLSFPKGAVVRTVLTDLSPDALTNGATLIHEHLGADVDLMVDELRAAAVDGLGCLVNATTNRKSDEDIEKIKQIARRAPVHIVQAGAYLEDLGFQRYPQHVHDRSEQELIEEFVSDANRQRWGAFGEVGTSLEMQPDERKVLRAIGQAHVRTGLPIFTHVPHEGCPTCALEQLEIFESQGVDPRHVCIGHLATIQISQDPKMETHKKIAARGAFVDFGPVGHEMTRSHVPEAEKVKRLMMLLDAGLDDHIVMTSDLGNPTHYKANWGNGYSTVMMQFVPKLRFAGVKETTIRKILVDNPRRFLAFVPKS
jgi:phosphotriesterase-related protein